MVAWSAARREAGAVCARCPCGMHHGTARIAWDAGGGGWQLAGSLAFALAPVEGQGDGRCLGRRSTQVLRRGRGFAPEGTGSPGTGSPGGLGAPGRVLLREGAGSPVDGRSGNDRVTRGRTDGRTAVDRVARRMRPACRPPPLLPFVDSHLRGQTAPGATDGTVVFARLEASKSQSPSSGGGSRGGRRWLAQWAIARPILNRSRSQHFSDHQPPHGGRPHTQVRRVCGGGDRCVGQYGSEPTSSWRRSCPSVLPPFPWGLRVNLPVSAVEPQPSLRERRATLSAPLCRETLPRSAGRGERGSKGQQTHLLPSNGLMPPPPCA